MPNPELRCEVSSMSGQKNMLNKGIEALRPEEFLGSSVEDDIQGSRSDAIEHPAENLAVEIHEEAFLVIFELATYKSLVNTSPNDL